MEKKQRLIDAEDLLQTLAVQFDNLDPRWLRDRSIREGLKIAKNAIEAAPTVDAAPVQHREWISVKDRLPKSGKMVLAIVGGKVENITLSNAYELAEFNMDEGWILELWPAWEDPKVSYWMPLPEPPKEE